MYSLEKEFNTVLIREESPDQEIAEMDPLNLDYFFGNVFTKSIKDGNVDSLMHCGSSADIGLILEKQDIVQARAAIRDLDMITSALIKMGVHNKDTRAITDKLSALATVASEIPRDTVYSYGPRNPKGDRMRRFTDLPEEKIFIESFRAGMKYLTHSIDSLEAVQCGKDSEPFSEVLVSANQGLVSMVEAILSVRRNVPPEIFTNQLRPFFDPYEVSGVEYLAPGGASMPIILVDYVLWSGQTDDQWYTEYLNTNKAYLTPKLREQLQRMGQYKNLYDTFIENIQRGNSVYIDSLDSLIEVFTTLIQFRAPHKRVADDNFKLRPGEAVGSGGHTVDILQLLINETFTRLKTLKELKKSL
jgi:hypothetical protein